MKFPWKHDTELESKLKESSPFLEVKEQLVPRYQFGDRKEN